MKRLLYLITSLLLSASAMAQAPNTTNAISSENTFALVIGIANYQDDRLNLNYSNRDAEEFATYLRSSAGGSIPEDNIRLLIDTNASTAAIYQSLKWLKKKTELNQAQDEKSKCQVYIYFSGHGDVETETKANLGFLLGYNTLPNNYINNAVRIEDLNDYAHTLSVDLNANVIIITDACHSGKLAGSDNRGTYLAGTALAMARDREIRIASCDPDQLSMEDERWGNGRGVFSWYLINGLKGMADRNGDKIVTLNEAKQYVDSSIAADEVLKELKHKQTPVIKGNPQFRLADISPEIFRVMMSAPAMAPRELSLPEKFWKALRDNVPDISELDFKTLQRADRKGIPRLFLQQLQLLWDSTKPDIAYIPAQLAQQLGSDTLQTNSFTEKLVEWLHNKGQEVINQYLAGDEAALEKRRYYNIKNSGYDQYPALYATAMQLTDRTDPLYNILLLNQYYFTGVAGRLRMPLVSEAEQKAIIEKALSAQLKAIALNDNAAFVQNELGVIYQYKKELATAEKYFTTATALAPTWAIPYSNLCVLYIQKGDTAKAAAAGTEAVRLQPDLQNTQIALGLLDEKNGNYLYAEESYRKAIDINSRHFLPFERLGNVYLQTTHYAQADSFYHEAAIRKKGYHFNKNSSDYFSNVVVAPLLPFMPCKLDTSILLQDDIMAFFYWGMTLYESKKYIDAERVFKKIVALDKINPLVFHYLGKVYYDQQSWEKAEIMFKMAYRNALSRDSFLVYCDSLIKGKQYPYDHTCFESFFLRSHYPPQEDSYFLGTMYESWNHPDEAEHWFRNAIQVDSLHPAGYYKCWQLFERQGRYPETEAMIRNYGGIDKQSSDLELNAFYRRMTVRFPDRPEWFHRLGILLYGKATLPNEVKNLDTIIWFPRINREVFIDRDTYKKLGTDPYVLDQNEPGTPDKFHTIEYKRDILFVGVPGTNESIAQADLIYTPRKDAIYYLKLADSLTMETNTKADINFKIGNVYSWSGSQKMAYPYYVQSVSLEPDNANARINLVDVCKTLFKHREGINHLSYLYDHTQINLTKRLLYGEWSIHAGMFDKAYQLLTEAKAVYPYPLPTMNDLMGRLYLMRKEPQQAISFYKAYDEDNNSDALTQYTIAKLYQQSGNTNEAWKWLSRSLQNGFNYGYVLEEDRAWEKLRNTSRWNALLKKYPMKKYKEPAR